MGELLSNFGSEQLVRKSDNTGDAHHQVSHNQGPFPPHNSHSQPNKATNSQDNGSQWIVA